MAAVKTLNFLPEIFRTDTNKKFLSATVEQLISEPNFKRVNGYIGRRVAPTFKSSDNYILEPNKDRQNYQLEPCVVVEDAYADTVDFFSSYRDLLQKISYYGGSTAKQDRLFNNEYYSFDGGIDFDKFVNFSNYYWMPTGPDAVSVFAGIVDSEGEYDVTRNIVSGGYNFTGKGKGSNPVLTLARGGTYVFNVDQPGYQFWIQSEPGAAGRKKTQPSVSTRNVLGVINNGNDQGNVTFRVPLVDAQERFTSMPVVAQADFATDISYSSMQGHSLVEFLRTNPNGIDGAKSAQDLDGKYLIFVNDDIDDIFWTPDEIYDFYPYDVVRADTIPVPQRRNLWRISVVPLSDYDYVINLIPSSDVLAGEKVFVRRGTDNANKEYYIDYNGIYEEVPLLTANADRLYYQDSSDTGFVGEIRLVDANNNFIDVVDDIIGKKNYISPNGVTFTNGLKVKFDNQVIPESYQGNEYYVEGVGKSIRLVAVKSLVNYGYFDQDLQNLDYITINRGSSDLNAWTRSNRWFHIDVLKATASYNNSTDLPSNDWRAKRPIIEFEANLQLFNYGRVALSPVDHLDFYVTDAFSQLEGRGNPYSDIGHYDKDSIVTIRKQSTVDGETVDNIVIYRATSNVQQIPGNTGNWRGAEICEEYLSTFAYSKNRLVEYGDGIYRSTINTEGADPSTTYDWKLIAKLNESFVEYDSSIAYLEGDVVSYNDKYYICKISGARNVAPDQSESVWGTIGIYVRYNETTADTIKAGHYALHEGILYQAEIDIKQEPSNENPFWEEIISVDVDKTIIFAGEIDPIVRNSVYRISTETIDDRTVLHLVQEGESVVANNTVIVKDGVNQGKSFWYDGSSWYEANSKTQINQPPKFDIIDEDDYSLGNKDRYPVSTFTGTELFSYKIGSGSNDTILGFPLSYRNFGNVGDIEFNNNFDIDTFTYLSGTQEVTENINRGYLISYIDVDNIEYRNIWTKVNEPSRQYQIISHTYDGTTNYFEIDIEPNESSRVPYVKVYVDNQLVKESQYQFDTVGARRCIRIRSSLLKIDSAIDIMIYSDDVSAMGYYEVPLNLDFNSLNLDFKYLTLGQLRNHTFTLVENTQEAIQTTGVFNGLRDIQYKDNGGSILQHSAPTIYSTLFLQDNTVNFVDSIELASREYNKFKNKFLELAAKNPVMDLANIPTEVDKILKEINLVKTDSFAWYYSDMVPYGDNRMEYIDTVINPELRQFDLPVVFNDLELSNRAVLVYVNDRQLTKGRDYYFPQDRTAVIIKDSYLLQADDTVRVVDYLNTDGSYVPETPSKLGLYPKFMPYKFLDKTYRAPTDVIQGHDGSLTPAFGDYRDELLLELELRIYNNIKVDYNESIVNIHNYVPGKFRDAGYSLNEFDRVLGRSFLRWAGNNRIDFTTNTTFLANDPWSWNYWKYKDTVNGEQLPGSWRAIFNYFYDTDRPNTHPWEMLGFSIEPDWWEDRYGPAPYTGGNLLLWEDLSQGYIHAGPRAGYDARYARPDLLKIIPSDDYGVLRPPVKFAVKNFNNQDASRSFAVGNQGPAESAWRKSSDYPFALQKAIALTRPAFYFGSLINVKRYNRNEKLDQLVITETLQRIKAPSVKIHGDIENGAVVRVSGYLNWIRDYVKTLGQDPVGVIRHRLDNLDIRLGYQVAGYTDKNYIKILAEQSSPTSTNDSVIIPEENYKIHLSKGSPSKKIVYSAVIVEKTANGYSVSGYDSSNPYFTIIPSLANNNAYAVQIGQQRGVIYKDFQNKKVTVPYGYEFTTRQQLVDFLVSYGRYLAGQGLRFTDSSAELKDRKDWILSVKEFLHWSQQGWQPGNLIILSPASSSLRVATPMGVVDHITNTINGSKLIDQQFGTIKSNQFTVVRTDNEFKVSVLDGRTICLAELEVVQYEHSLIFDNTTVFNDIIYKPELGNRQFRLKLVGNKTNDWTGEMNPPGFIYNNETVDQWQSGKDYKKGSIVDFKEQYYTALENIIASDEFDRNQWRLIDKSSIKTGLLPNFAYNAEKFQEIYNIDETPADIDLLNYGSGLIGFRERSYLSDFGLDNVSQVKFYQGYIKDKGTKNSINALTSAELNNTKSEINYYEEWAVRVGEYGSIESDAQIEVILDESRITNDPSIVSFLDAGDKPEPGAVGFSSGDIYKKTSFSYNKDIFINRDDDTDVSKDILTAGYVNIDDVDGTVFDIRNQVELDNFLPKAARGFKIWVAKDFDDDWNVYRLTETDNSVVSARYDLDDQLVVNFDIAHSLTVGEVFVIKNFNPMIDGFYRVSEVLSAFNVSVTVYKNIEDIKFERTFSGNGVFLKTESMRMPSGLQIGTNAPIYGWKVGDRVWVDTNFRDGRYAVYEKTQPWQYTSEILPEVNELEGQDKFGSSVKINSTGDFLLSGSPGTGAGNVKVFAKSKFGGFEQHSSISPIVNGLRNFGQVIDLRSYTSVIGAPGSNIGGSLSGLAAVYNFRDSGIFIDPQLLIPTEPAAGGRDIEFGYSIAISDNLQWIYVGAPGQDKVYVYSLTRVDKLEDRTLSTESGTLGYTLPFVPFANDSIQVIRSDNEEILLPGYDYEIDGDQITFTSDPTELSFRIKQGRFYRHEATISGDEGTRFGHSIKTNNNGSILIISAPDADKTVNSETYLRAGAVYIYHRRVEKQVAQTTKSICLLSPATTNVVDVYINDVLAEIDVDYVIENEQSIVLADELSPGQIITVGTKTFDLIETLESPDNIKANKFGHTIDYNDQTGMLIIGATGYYDDNYRKGKVYRYSDLFKSIKRIWAAEAGDLLTAGTTLYINDIAVDLTSTSVNDLIEKIGSLSVSGVLASIEDNRLVLTDTSNNVSGIKFFDSNGSNISALGFSRFVLQQSILSTGNDSYFANNVKINPAGNTVLISSKSSKMFKPLSFDNSTTTFDVGSSNFTDIINGTGIVEMYEIITDSETGLTNTGTLVYAEKFTQQTAAYGDKFGESIDIIHDTVLISSPYHENIPDSSNYDLIVDGSFEFTHINTLLLPDGFRLLVRSDRNENGNWSLWKLSSLNDGRTPGTFRKMSVGELTDHGSLYLYSNNTWKQCWSIIREQGEKVALASVNSLAIYNKNTNIKLANLDFIDPAKGKILGPAEQDIDFKTEYDPAIYTNASGSLTVDRDMRWGDQQVGMIWWDLSKIRYLDYEQSSLSYRAANWAKAFPGSTIEICEWVSSYVPPDQYVARGGLGTPKYDSSAYVVDTVVDEKSGIVNPRYYFWVVNKEEVTSSKKKNSAAAISRIIEQPQLQGIPYAGILSSDSLALFGVNPYLSGDSVVLQIDYTTVPNNNTVHSEFELIQENRGMGSEIPAKIINKMIDSLSGIDNVGNVVPDPKLSGSERVGISFRPRQSMFHDREKALRSVVLYANSVFAKYPITRQFNISRLKSQDPLPGASAYDRVVATVDELQYIDTTEISDGYRVLIKEDTTNDGLWTIWNFVESRFVLSRIQTYKTDLYWDFIDWYASDFDPTVKPTYTVDTEKEIASLYLEAGNTVKVLYDREGKFSIYRVSSDLSLDVVGIQQGTIQLSSRLYQLISNGMGFDASNFDIIRFDKTPGIEIRLILKSILEDIFVNEFKIEFNKLFFVVANYILSEQTNVDWLFKTSFISVIHQLRKLEQYPGYVKDNQDYYINYINEVKPYRTQIREYLLDYTGTENFNGDVTDFDLPAYYDRGLDQYRTPNGEKHSDASLLAGVNYRNWNSKHTFVIDEILVADGGEDYTVIPEITIIGGGGTGATAVANINYNSIVSVTVTNPGKGYTSTPTVVINGNGTGAKLYPVVKQVNYRDSNENSIRGYNLVRSLDSTVKFDRITYEASIPVWKPNLKIVDGWTPRRPALDQRIYSNLVIHDGQVYQYNKQNVFAVPVIMSSIETSPVRLISTFEVTDFTLTSNSVVEINGIRAINNIVDGTDYYHILGQNITILNPTIGDVITVSKQGNSQEFEIVAVKEYQTVKPAKLFDIDGVMSPKIFVGDRLKVKDQDYTVNENTITFTDNVVLLDGQQIKVYVENSNVVAIQPDESFAKRDSEESPWYIELDGQQILIDDISALAVGHRVRGSGVNNFNNQVIVNEIDVESGTINLVSEEKIYTPKGTWEGGTWTPAEESTYSLPPVLVSGKDVVEILYFTSGIETDQYFDYRDFDIVEGRNINNAIDRALAYYIVAEGGTGEDPAQSIKGLRYPGAQVQGLPFDQEETLSSVNELIDTHISSRYKDIQLGTRPEDITVDGGEYVDRFNSHAPEELVPGIIFDSLNMQVFTQPLRIYTSEFTSIQTDNETQYILPDAEITDASSDSYELLTEETVRVRLNNVLLVQGEDYDLLDDEGTPVVRLSNVPPPGSTLTIKWFEVTGQMLGYRVFHDMSEAHKYYRISKANTTELVQDLELTDTEIVVKDARALTIPQPRDPGLLFINGEMISYLRNYATEKKYTWEEYLEKAPSQDDVIIQHGSRYYMTVIAIRNITDFQSAIDQDLVRPININTLTRIRRGINGTGAPVTHKVGELAVDAGKLQIIPGDTDTTDWLNSAEEFGFKDVGFDFWAFDSEEATSSSDSLVGFDYTGQVSVTPEQSEQLGDLFRISPQVRFLVASPSFIP